MDVTEGEEEEEVEKDLVEEAEMKKEVRLGRQSNQLLPKQHKTKI